MTTEAITITQHAWERFKERWEGPTPDDFREKLNELLRSAVPEDLGHASAIRIIDNGFQPATYYTSENWRFVFDEAGKVLLTCERAYLKAGKKKRKLFNRARYGLL